MISILTILETSCLIIDSSFIYSIDSLFKNGDNFGLFLEHVDVIPVVLDLFCVTVLIYLYCF